MLGYFAPMFKKLTIDERKYYNTLYCSSCFSIKQNYGTRLTQLMKNDFIFFILILDNIKNILPQKIIKRNCCVFKYKKVSVFEQRQIFDIIADLNIYSIYLGIMDGLIDSPSKNKYIEYKQKYKKQFIRNFLKLNKIIPSFKTINIKILKFLMEEEEKRNPEEQIYHVVDSISDIFSFVFIEDKKEAKKISEELLKIMYHMDAYEDYFNDLKTGRNNIYNSIFDDFQSITEYSRMKISESLLNLENMLKTKRNKNIILNIVKYSIPGRFNKIKEKWSKKDD
jgi:hypothetical protein